MLTNARSTPIFPIHPTVHLDLHRGSRGNLWWRRKEPPLSSSATMYNLISISCRGSSGRVPMGLSSSPIIRRMTPTMQ